MLTGRSGAVIFLNTADEAHNTTTPGDNSGWQYEGKFNDFLGVPIAPYFFITANHIGGAAGNVLDFHGDAYTTISFQVIPNTDLRVWEVDHAKPFPTYAPISSHEEVGYTYTNVPTCVIGRGTLRGNAITVSAELKGWDWGNPDFKERWGRNVIENTVTHPTLGEFLYCDFDNPGVVDECHLSSGDSGGGLFVLEDGLWKLAGIHFAVDGPFRIPPAGPSFNAALFDCRGLEFEDKGNWVPVPDGAENVPSSFYSSRVSSSLPWLRTNVGSEVDSLAPEDFSAWCKLYFNPTELADAQVSGPLADPDGDGVSNLLEYALNLDQTFGEPAEMQSGGGIRGLPIGRVEMVDGEDRLTLEFVRRTFAGGSDVTYVVEFSSDLVTWEIVGAEVATGINARWDRVKISDSLTTTIASKRFVRLRVVLAE